MNRAGGALPSWVNGMSLFYAAWMCGVIAIIGPDVAATVGGVLLLGAAGLVATRPDDKLWLRFLRSAVGPRRIARILTVAALAAIGAAWLVWGLAEPSS